MRKHRTPLACATADIVDGQRNADPVLPVRDDAGMRQAPANPLGEDVARAPARRIVGDRDRRLLPPPEGREVGNAAVVDIAVGATEPPILGIGAKIGAHVGVDQRLKVERQRIAKGADHDIGAHALDAVDVAVRKGQHRIGGVIAQRDADLPARRRNEPLRMGRGHRLPREAERPKAQPRTDEGAPCRLERGGRLDQFRFAQMKTTGSACWRNRSFLKAVSAL